MVIETFKQLPYTFAVFRCSEMKGNGRSEMQQNVLGTIVSIQEKISTKVLEEWL
jgi:hypothetical protein